MDLRLRRTSMPVVNAALRARRDSLNAARTSSERRASIEAFKESAPGFKNPVLEHLVMFKVKEDTDSEEISVMTRAVHELRALDGVEELTVGAALSVQGGNYSHVLHGRYRDKMAFAAFEAHPIYAEDVKDFLRRQTEDVVTLDWECKPYGPYLDTIMSKRITLVKIKEGTSADDMRFLEESIPRLLLRCPTIGQTSAGAIPLSDKAKGFQYGILELFPSTEDEEEVFASVEHIAWQDTKLRPIARALLLADFHADGT